MGWLFPLFDQLIWYDCLFIVAGTSLQNSLPNWEWKWHVPFWGLGSPLLSVPSSLVWEMSFIVKAVIKPCGCCFFAASASSTALADRGPISSSYVPLQREERVLIFLDFP